MVNDPHATKCLLGIALFGACIFREALFRLPIHTTCGQRIIADRLIDFTNG
jgi:hypothetical protein